MKRSFFATWSRPVIAVVAVMFPFTVWWALLALRSNRNDVKEWLPDTFQATQDYREFQSHFGDETFILVSWDGCTLDDERLDRLAELLVPAEKTAEEGYFESVLTGRGVIDRLTTPPTSLSYDAAIGRLTGTLVGPDGHQSCAVLTLSDLGRENLRLSVQEVYDATAQLGIERESVRMGGPPIDNVAIDIEGERMLLRLMGLAGLVGLGLAWWFLRDWRLTFMVFVGGVYSAVLCLALVYVLGGTMNSILLTMPAVVYTAGLATAMHIVNYYRHARVEVGVERAVERGVAHAWMPCVLASGTTSLGLIALTISDLVPIQNFGYYTALGVAVAVGFMFLYLPSALQLWPPRRQSRHADDEVDPFSAAHHGRMRWIGQRLVARAAWIWIIFFGLMVVGGSGLLRAKTSISLMSLFSPESEIIQSYTWLERHLGPLVPMEVVVRFDLEKTDLSLVERMRVVEQVQQAAESIPDVGGTMSAVTFAPDLAPRRRRGLGGVLLPETTYDIVLNRRLAAHRDELIRERYLADDHKAGEELWRISLRVAALEDIDYGKYIDDIRNHVEPVVDHAREEGNEGFVGVTYTGMTPVVYMAERALMDGLIKSFGGAFIMIAVVMSVVFRDPRAGLLTMLPNVFPMTVVFGLMSWGGMSLDIGTMMTASVAMGHCVDDTVHYAHWFRLGTRAGLDRREAVVSAFENTAGVIYQTSAIVALGLATFSLSNFMPTQRFGLLMFTLLACGLLADLAMTPVMMAGRLGRYFTAGYRPPPPPEPSEQESTDQDVYVA